MKVEIMKIKTAMIGLGSVNRNLLTILHEKRNRLRDEYGLEFEITCVADSSGVGVNGAGFNPISLRDHKADGNAVSDLSEYRQDETILDVLNEIDIDLVFEASPVDLKSGGVGLSICRTRTLAQHTSRARQQGTTCAGFQRTSEAFQAE